MKSLRGAQVLTPATPDRRAGIVTVRLPGVDAERCRERLAGSGIVCACRAGGLRFSPHFYNEAAQFDVLLEKLKAII
jgi:selenocysteine lyase/cysteine desulfurase